MAPQLCCGFRRAPSPEPQPVHLVETSQTTKGRFALSSHGSSLALSRREASPIQEIFASDSKEEGDIAMPTTPTPDQPSQHEIDSGFERRTSSRRVLDVAKMVRKRMSRDSGISKRSSKRGLTSSMSKEDIERRNELKRALHERVRTDIREDPDNIYDEDAIPIKTPAATFGRHEGLIHISPKHLSNAMKRSQSPSASVHIESHQRDPQQSFIGTNTTAALSRMLTQRASHVTEGSEDQTGIAEDVALERTRTKKYIFNEEDSPKKEYQSRSPSPLRRSKTVIRIPSANHSVAELQKPHFLDPVEYPLSPELLPLRLASTRDSVANNDRRLSSDKRGSSLPLPLTGSKRMPAMGTILSGVYDTKIRPASEQWLHGASGILGRSVHQQHLSEEHPPGRHTIHDGHHCDPSSEETDFGGIDGEDDSPPYSVFRTARNSSNDKEPHMYNMHIPKRLASTSLSSAVSLPQLQGNKRQRSYNKGDSSDFSVNAQHQTSSPRIMPMAWDNIHQPRESSSVYSSQPESLFSSGRSSIVQGMSLADRFQQHEGHMSSDSIISVPASRPKPVDLDKLERQTMSTSFHSSHESLYAKELASAEARIQPVSRAQTLPKNSRFREDLKSISDEIARTNPYRRGVSNVDGGGDHRHFSVDAYGSKEAPSVWEKALREHSREDSLLRHTRLGSDLLPKQIELDDGPLSTRRPSSRPSLERSEKHHAVESWSGSNLQARLAAYELPSRSPPPPTPQASPLAPVESRVRQPKMVDDQRSGSWSRYPSHTRYERSSSPAGQTDQVFARDFAEMTPGTPLDASSSSQSYSKPGSSEVKTRSTYHHFPKDIIGSLKRIYRTQSQELQRRLQNEARGHRSSVSEGGVLEYPELELLGSISPPMPMDDFKPTRQVDDLHRSRSPLKRSDDSGFEAVAVEGGGAGDGASDWSEHYRDCVKVVADEKGGSG
ncbi:hypothetical protein P7C71_g4099, partial [Lecanoromycetidae sp. Uapishka_2]